MSFVRKAAFVNSAEFVSLSITILQTAVLTRALGPTLIGQYALILSFLMLTPQVCCLGLPLSFLYYSQHAREKTKEYLVNTVWMVLFVTVLGGMILCLLILMLPNYFGFVPWFALIGVGLYVPIFSCGIIARNALLIRLDAKKLGLIRILSAVCGAALILILYFAGTLRLPQALWCFVLASAAATVLSWIWIRDYADFSIEPSWKTSLQLGSMGIRLGWVDLLIVVNSQLSILIVKHLLGDFDSVGYFSRGQQVAMLAVIAGRAILPMLFSRWASLPEEKLGKHVEKVMRFASTISILLVVGLMLSGKWVILALYGRKFMPSLAPMMILVPGAVLYLLSKTLFLLLGSRGVPELSALALLMGALVNIVASILLVPTLGISGAAWAFTISNIALLLLLALVIKKKYDVRITECICVRKADLEGIFKQF